MFRGTNPLAPKSNWHRMLTMLHLNGGTLYRAQMYLPQSRSVWENGTVRTIPAPDHSNIDTGDLRKMTRVSTFAPLEYAYEHRAEVMGLVTIQYHKNRKWVTLLPKGKEVLCNFLDKGRTWNPQHSKP